MVRSSSRSTQASPRCGGAISSSSGVGLAGLAVVLIVSASVAARATAALTDGARERYAAICASCHGADLRGGTAVSLTQSPLVASGDREALARVIRDGSADGAMPGFGAALAEEELAGLIALLQQEFEREARLPPRGVGATIEAESLNVAASSGYTIMRTEADPNHRYIGFFGGMSALCYDDVDLTGVRSIELEYARGADEPGRFAILITDGNGLGIRTNLGEADSVFTGGWETFERHRIGLSRELRGRHTLIFFGVEGGGIFNLDRFTLSDQLGENDGTATQFSAASGVFTAGGHQFRLERVAEAPSELWAMTFLPDGSIAATQKNGHLVLFRDGELFGPIVGTPPVWNRVQGGLLAVTPHPDYAQNGWLYLAFSDPGPGEGMESLTMTRIVRGRIEGRRWVEQQDIYKAAPEFYTSAYAHFGCRLVFLDDHLYFSIGDRTQMQLAQDLSHPAGKIHRLRADGSVPTDNPFVKRDSALASIWSYGHRNPQGLTVHPQTREIWSAEHGPRGGDELNLIRRELNYGWPLATHGIDYDGTPIADGPSHEGTEPPVYHWTPSIGVSQIAFSTAEHFPRWRGHVLVASLGAEELRLLRMAGARALDDDVLFKGLGRIRDVVIGPDGYPYVVLSHPNGSIYRLMPVDGE